MIYCSGERQDIDESYFLHRSDGTIFQPYIHDADPPHYPHFINGTRVSTQKTQGFPIPGTASIVAGPVYTQIQVPDHINISLHPGDEVIGIELLDPQEGDAQGQIVNAAQHRQRILAIQLFQMAQELPSQALEDLVKHAEDLMANE